jgi:hypothetical protein
VSGTDEGFAGLFSWSRALLDTAVEETDEIMRLTETEARLLAVFFSRYPDPVSIGAARTRDLDQNSPRFPAEAQLPGRNEAPERLERDALIARAYIAPGGPLGDGDLLHISPRGIRALFRHYQLVTREEFARPLAAASLAVEGLQRAQERGEHERHRLEARLDRLASTLAQTERRFFGQILTVSAVLVAAFALIVTGGQVVQQQSQAAGIDAAALFYRALAVMVPVTGAVIALVVAAWLFSWVRPDAGYDPRTQTSEIRPPLVDDQD